MIHTITVVHSNKNIAKFYKLRCGMNFYENEIYYNKNLSNAINNNLIFFFYRKRQQRQQQRSADHCEGTKRSKKIQSKGKQIFLSFIKKMSKIKVPEKNKIIK